MGYLNSVTNNNSFNLPCNVTAWLDPGHGFLEYNCAGVNEVWGFYPNEDNRKFNIKHRMGALKIGQGVLDHIVALPLLTAAAVIKARSWWTNVPIIENPRLTKGINDFIGGLLKYKVGYALLKFAGERQGEVRNDSALLASCLEQDSCAYSRLALTADQAKRAYEYIQQVREATQGKNQTGLTGKFSVFEYNCVDFVKNAMERTGVVGWLDNFKYTRPPTLIERILAFSWHYFEWAKFRT